MYWNVFISGISIKIQTLKWDDIHVYVSSLQAREHKKKLKFSVSYNVTMHMSGMGNLDGAELMCLNSSSRQYFLFTFIKTLSFVITISHIRKFSEYALIDLKLCI